MLRSTTFRFGLIVLAISGLALAQDQPPVNPQPSSPAGGWRRVGDPPVTAAQAQSPVQPVERSDAYGQPIGQQPPQETMPAEDQPPAQQTPPPPPAAASRPVYGLPPELVLKPGTYVTIRVDQPLSSDHNQPGDTFTGSLFQPVVVDGVVVAQRGQLVYGRVAEVERQRSDRPSRLGLELTGLTLADGTQAPIRSQLVARQGGTTPAGQQIGTVATTTGVGAMIGAAAAWGTGAAVGAGIGAAAGLIGVMVTRNRPTVVYPEAVLTFRNEAPVTVSTVNAPQAFRYVGPGDYDRPPAPQPRLQARPAPPSYYYGPAYPYPYYPYYWGTGVSIYWGPGFFYGRGHYRRWR